MRAFQDENFLLSNETARRLYWNHAAKMPIIDYHNHLNPQEIYEDGYGADIARLWLGGDHYKWRAMRANGVSEDLVTGNGDAYEKFKAWADTIRNCIGNPLYHWTHLELLRYFDIEEALTPDTAEEIWTRCNEALKQPEYSVRNLLAKQQVEVLCTTDDPADDLKWHKKLKEEGFAIQVLPTFRPDKALAMEKAGFEAYIQNLGALTREDVSDVDGVLAALEKRLDYFVEAGCRVTDHSLERSFYVETSLEEVNAIYQKRMAGEMPTSPEIAAYRGYVLTELGRRYARRKLVMQLHIGALRNNSTRMFEKLGADTGFDCANDFNYAPQLSALLDAMDLTDELPKTVLYYLNSKDTDMLAAMAGNFQGNELGIRGKVQLGSAWWFGDHKLGMERQMDSLASVGLLSTFVGMLTDSRSFLSFPRHEYFRRLLCNKIGTLVESGEYPKDMAYLGKMVEDICYNNVKAYLNL